MFKRRTAPLQVDVPAGPCSPCNVSYAVSAALAGEVSGAFVPAEPFTYLNHHAA